MAPRPAEPISRSNASATSCAGTRTANVSSPALASRLTRQPARARQHQRQADPARTRRQGVRVRRSPPRRRTLPRRSRIMADQRIEPRPILCGEDGRHGAIVGRIRAEPVDRFGAERDQRAVAQQCGRARDAVGIGWQHFRHDRLQIATGSRHGKGRDALLQSGNAASQAAISRGVSTSCSTSPSPSRPCQSPARSCC